MDLEAALVADKVLCSLQHELRNLQRTFLSSEDRTKLENFIRALDAVLPFKRHNYPKEADPELVATVASLRKKKRILQAAKKAASEKAQASIPQPTGSLSVSLYTS
jgi:hypothetical protein